MHLRFEEICNDGSAWRTDNWLVKLHRCTLNVVKQLYLLFVTMSLPTNHLMLTFRTLPRDFAEPSSNSDDLACRFRNAVMPTRGRLHDRKSVLITINRFFIEFPVLGIPGIVRFIDVRTQWFDDGVSAAIADGISQVVIIAAGFDTRAYRLARPGVRFFEIDLPHASTRKQDLVEHLLPASEYPRPEFVSADLAAVRLGDVLQSTSFDPAQRSLFIAEGLLYYLPPSAVQQLLTCVSSVSQPGSRLMFDFLHLSALSGSHWCPGLETLMLSVWNKGEVMYSGVDECPGALEQLMYHFGFRLRQQLCDADVVRLYMHHARPRSRSCPPVVSPYFGYLAAEKM